MVIVPTLQMTADSLVYTFALNYQPRAIGATPHHQDIQCTGGHPVPLLEVGRHPIPGCIAN